MGKRGNMKLVFLVMLGALVSFQNRASASSVELDSLALDRLQSLDQRELNQTYAQSEAGKMPDGDSNGKALFFPGTILAPLATQIASIFWQGKIFNTKEGVLVNKVLFFQAIKAKVFYGQSWFDGKESIIIDYKETSIVAGLVRDEIREVGPGVYLGRAYLRTLLGPVLAINFALDFNN
jgi:hypothetical protein